MNHTKGEDAADSVVQHVIQVIAGYFQRDCTGITRGSRLVEDLGADSLELLEVTLALNDYFDVDLPESALSRMRTVGDFCDAVHHLLR